MFNVPFQVAMCFLIERLNGQMRKTHTNMVMKMLILDFLKDCAVGVFPGIRGFSLLSLLQLIFVILHCTLDSFGHVFMIYGQSTNPPLNVPPPEITVE